MMQIKLISLFTDLFVKTTLDPKDKKSFNAQFLKNEDYVDIFQRDSQILRCMK
jgi:hypothetical protein